MQEQIRFATPAAAPGSWKFMRLIFWKRLFLLNMNRPDWQNLLRGCKKSAVNIPISL